MRWSPVRTHYELESVPMAVSGFVLQSQGTDRRNNEVIPFRSPLFYDLENIKFPTSSIFSYASIITILLFSIERYIAVCHPFVFVKIKALRQNVSF